MHKINFGNSTGIKLDKNWGLLPDPMNRCRAQKWWKSKRRENYWFPSYDDDAFWPTKVPGAFNRVHDELKYYEGNVVYLNHFPARKCTKGEKAFLHFEGIAEYISVFLNGYYLGEYEGGYTPVTFDATRAIDDQNRLLILCENNRSAERVPGTIHDWWHDGGIIRPVSLHYRPETYIRDVRICTELRGDKIIINCGVLLSASSRDNIHTTNVAISDASGVLCEFNITGRPGSWLESTVELSRDAVNLWSCEQPYMYKITARCNSDLWEDSTGLREITTSGTNILLNGSPVILRGAAAWIEDRDCGLFSLTEESAATTVKLLKELNANFARAGHRPNSLAFSRACDAAGILLWVEVPAYWIPTMAKPYQSRLALQALEGAICAFRNSPSVILWSVGNECLWRHETEEQSNLAYFLEAADYAQINDPSRLVTYTGGIEGCGTEEVDRICPIELVEKLDVIGFNSYAGINDGASPDQDDEFMQQYDKPRFASKWGKPVIHAEAGIDAVLGEQGYDFGEQRQADYHAKLQKYFAECTEEGSLQGIALFVLNDFSTPIKLGRYQRGFNRKGLVDQNLTPKPAFEVVRNGFAAIKARNS